MNHGSEQRSMATETTEQYDPANPAHWSELGRRLRQLREEIIASGQPMLEDEAALRREIAERRGGVVESDQ